MRRSLENITRLPAWTAHELGNVWILARSGMMAPMRPDRAARVAVIGARWGRRRRLAS
jgi:hypothetical protein